MSENTKPFRQRLLTEERNVFEHNAWDNVVWDIDQEREAMEKVKGNSTNKVSPDATEQYETNAGLHWDEFYSQHQNRFFKDRHWLFTEFPELSPQTVPVAHAQDDIQPSSSHAHAQDDIRPSSAHAHAQDKNETRDLGSGGSQNWPGETANYRIFEVGCGVGNTIFPIIQTTCDQSLFVYGCDLSNTAVQLVKEHADYDVRRCHAFVADVSDSNCDFPFPSQSLDVIVLIFVLSAISPHKMQSTVERLARALKPGGLIVFRDYGRYDLAQLRFKDGKCLSDNFYVRGDGTRVYFFEQDELKEMFTHVGLQEEQNMVDRRLQVNRGKQLTMYRVWIQCKYRKPAS